MKLPPYKKVKNVILPIYYKFRPVFVIPKQDLKHAHYYQGYSTYFNISKWNAEHEYFLGIQDFGTKKIVHIHDRLRDEIVFVPIKEITPLDVFQRQKAFKEFMK